MLIVVGQFDDLLDGVIDGVLGYVIGLEYCEEFSDNCLDFVVFGQLFVGIFYIEGQFVSEVLLWLNFLIGIDNVQQFNMKGEYDVLDVFLEVCLFIFFDCEFVYEFIVDGVVCVVDYFMLGNVIIWKLGFFYSFIEELNFCGIVLEVVCVLNIIELFDL